MKTSDTTCLREVVELDDLPEPLCDIKSIIGEMALFLTCVTSGGIVFSHYREDDMSVTKR